MDAKNFTMYVSAGGAIENVCMARLVLRVRL